MDELRLDAAVLTQARRNAEVAADMLWFRDTLRRVQVRYGRALAALAGVPGLVAAVNQWQVPEAAWNEAEALNTAVRGAVDELEQVSAYLEAVLDPGPATCQACGERLGVFQTEVGWQHYRTVTDPGMWSGERSERFDADHAPDPVFGRPDCPTWTDHNPDGPDEDGGEWA